MIRVHWLSLFFIVILGVWFVDFCVDVVGGTKRCVLFGGSGVILGIGASGVVGGTVSTVSSVSVSEANIVTWSTSRTSTSGGAVG